MRVAVCDCGAGNVRSVVRAIEHVLRGSAGVTLTNEAAAIRTADRIVVPGQGSFGAFAAAIQKGGLGEALVEKIHSGAPYLGICLGLQVLFEESEEAPGVRGLGILRGRVRRLAPGIDEATALARPLPHVGWNEVVATRGARLTGERAIFPPSEHFYFAHSYAAVPDDPAVVAATTEYGPSFASAVASDAIVGVQFHPEKSQRAGLALLERFFAQPA